MIDVAPESTNESEHTYYSPGAHMGQTDVEELKNSEQWTDNLVLHELQSCHATADP